MEAAQNSANHERPSPTVPSFQIKFLDVEAEAAQRFGVVIGEYIQEISRYIDLERLDGVTIANDYPAALRQLDRGFTASHELTPTASELVTGVAMTPSVRRDGVVKAHMVLMAGVIFPLEDEQHEFWKDALYVLAHECAHVEALKAIDTAFPNRVLQHVIADYIEVIHKQLNESCWDEYAASRLSAHFGSKQAAIYEGTFVSALKETRERANDHIRRYRLHNDHEAVLTDVAREYFELLRFASYLLGHLHGLGLGVTEDDAPVAHAALQDHWFAPHFIRLEQIFVTLWENFGKWGSPDDFDVIADLGMEILAEGGVHLTPLPEGGVYVHVPFSPNTLPMT